MTSEDQSSRGGGFGKRVLAELGLISVYHSSIDIKLLCLQRFVRLFAYGASTLILVVYLEILGISKTEIGLFMTLTLAGDVCISFFLTLFADALGRKAILVLGAAMMTASGVIFAVSGNYWILLLAAIIGVISPRSVSNILCVGDAKIADNGIVGVKSARFELSKRASSLISLDPTTELMCTPGTVWVVRSGPPLACSPVDGLFTI